ncbi:MAG: glutathione S-transferase [Myxococcaceae bacterium]|nr:glutathione S-transferase [Myxococcaceae bacterium]
MLTLIDLPISPYAQKVKLALLEKGLAFEVKRVPAKPPFEELRALSPRLELPVLMDGDFSLYDSSVIVEYLEDAYPEPALLPKSPRERARVRVIEELCDTAYDAVVWGVAELTVFQRGSGELQRAMLARASEQVAGLNARLEAELDGRAWLNGAQVGFGDIVAYPHVNAAASQGNKPAAGSKLEGWLRAMRQRPSVQRCKQDIVQTIAEFQAVPQLIASGEAKRQYRDHRLDWMLRSGGRAIVEAGLAADDLRFSTDY